MFPYTHRVSRKGLCFRARTVHEIRAGRQSGDLIKSLSVRGYGRFTRRTRDANGDSRNSRPIVAVGAAKGVSHDSNAVFRRTFPQSAEVNFGVFQGPSTRAMSFEDGQMARQSRGPSISINEVRLSPLKTATASHKESEQDNLVVPPRQSPIALLNRC